MQLNSCWHRTLRAPVRVHVGIVFVPLRRCISFKDLQLDLLGLWANVRLDVRDLTIPCSKSYPDSVLRLMREGTATLPASWHPASCAAEGFRWIVPQRHTSILGFFPASCIYRPELIKAGPDFARSFGAYLSGLERCDFVLHRSAECSCRRGGPEVGKGAESQLDITADCSRKFNLRSALVGSAGWRF